MKFEHIVQINDLNKPEIPPLSRFQVWEGLVLRARRPDKFLVGVEDYEFLEQEPGFLKRRVQLPGVEVVDEVRFFAEYKVDYSILPSESMPAGSLTMDIEEPEPGSLFVRFSYHVQGIENHNDSMPYDQYLKQAYVMTDIETIQIIRDLASTGVF